MILFVRGSARAWSLGETHSEIESAGCREPHDSPSRPTGSPAIPSTFVAYEPSGCRSATGHNEPVVPARTRLALPWPMNARWGHHRSGYAAAARRRRPAPPALHDTTQYANNRIECAITVDSTARLRTMRGLARSRCRRLLRARGEIRRTRGSWRGRSLSSEQARRNRHWKAGSPRNPGSPGHDVLRHALEDPRDAAEWSASKRRSGARDRPRHARGEPSPGREIRFDAAIMSRVSRLSAE